MSNEQLTFVAAALGVASLIAGLLIRAGRLRWWLANYWDPSLPSAQRAGGLLLMPMGVLFLVGVLGAALEAIGLSPFGIVVTFTALLAFIVIIPVIWSRPPSWLKPRWLRDLEVRAGADPALRARLAATHGRRFSPREYRLAWALLLAVLAASVLFSWPPTVLIGVGVAGVTLYARRPRRGKGRGSATDDRQGAVLR